jgi:hypothetical protein
MGLPSRYPKTDEAYALWKASKASTWAEFAAEQAWDTDATRKKYPVAAWVREKASEREKALAVDITGMMAERSDTWWRDVNKTLKEYPQLIDQIKQVLAYKVSLIAKQAKAHQKGIGEFKVDIRELRECATAAKALTEAKMQVLMLKDLQVKEFDVTAEGERKVAFALAGGQTPEQIRKVMDKWMNK